MTQFLGQLPVGHADAREVALSLERVRPMPPSSSSSSTLERDAPVPYPPRSFPLVQPSDALMPL
jgi:hypothetical protein